MGEALALRATTGRCLRPPVNVTRSPGAAPWGFPARACGAGQGAWPAPSGFVP